MHGPAHQLPATAAGILARVRERHPRVHCVTNSVAQNLTANALLAAGAIPSMTISEDEIGAFVAQADALLINLGTFDAGRRKATAAAIDAAQNGGKPWVLDPVLIDRSPARAAFARELAGRGPRAIRLNRAEFLALANVRDANKDAVQAYAAQRRISVAMTGASDVVADGARLATIANGHGLMAKVTALGCAESALLAACLAVESDAWLASASALLIMGVAGEIAAKRARGPGSFAVEILDALHVLDADALAAHARVS